MFKRVLRYPWCIAGLLFLCFQLPLTGQNRVQETNALQHQSVTQFQNEKYRKALEGFQKLLKRDPGNAMYAYYTGACMVRLNEGLEDAIELLYDASRKDVPANVHYFLATAYMMEYNFHEARKTFRKFETYATRQELKQYDIRKLIAICRSAEEITATYNPYEVMNVTFIDLYDSTQFTQVSMKGGQLQRKPATYFSKDEDREGLNSLMFMPSSLERGDYIYYTGYSRNKKGGFQLFRIKRGAGRTWGDPEEIRELNSDGDELIPYFDPIENDIYFASDGREGVGGFDLYRSHYDSERDEWSEPMNLGFPINSVMDDLLLLPGDDLGMVMFFSNRKGTDSTLTVYRVHMVEPKKMTEPGNTGMLKEIASLGGVATEALAELESVTQESPSGVNLVRSESREADQVGPEMKPSGTLVPGEYVIRKGTGEQKSDYQLILAKALRHQAISDSLKDLAASARAEIRESEDPNDRWVWQKQIMVWDKKSRDEEEAADLLYARLGDSSLAQSGQSGSAHSSSERVYHGSEKGDGPAESSTVTEMSREIPGTIEVDTVMDDLTLYRYTKTMRSLKGEPGISTESKAPLNRFDILGSSPYSEINAIPVDVPIPSGVFYRIQLGAFTEAVAPDAFHGISPITGETEEKSGIIRYYAGKFSRYEDASAALSVIRSRGYEDAFIVAWYNGVKVTTQRAKQLE